MLNLPNLPREWYFKLRELTTGLDITQWQAVILGIWAILELGTRDRARLDEMIAEVKARHQRSKREGVESS